jgi:hypothetical protein
MLDFLTRCFLNSEALSVARTYTPVRKNQTKSQTRGVSRRQDYGYNHRLRASLSELETGDYSIILEGTGREREEQRGELECAALNRALCFAWHIYKGPVTTGHYINKSVISSISYARFSEKMFPKFRNDVSGTYVCARMQKSDKISNQGCE